MNTNTIEEPTFEIIVANSTKEITDPSERESITSGYVPLWENIQKRMKAASAVTSDPKAAFRARNDLVPVRTEIERTRKALKEASLKKGKAIDGLAAALTYDITQEEARLKEIETAAERAEAARLESVKAVRMEALTGIITAETLLPPNLAILTDAEFDRYVAEQKDLAEIRAARAKREADEKAELERIAEEKRLADEAERLRIAAENARLKKEADEREAAAQKEREAAAAELKRQQDAANAAAAKLKKEADEREAKIKAEAEAVLAKEREEKAAAARVAANLLEKERQRAQHIEETARKEKADREAAQAAKELAKQQESDRAAAAPDKEKLAALAAAIRALEIPALTSRKAAPMVTAIRDAIEALALRVEVAADKI
jgi:hypothetical protein